MGHKKKDGKAGRTLHQQAYDKLQKMQAFGDSKRLDKLENPEEKFTAFRPTRHILST